MVHISLRNMIKTILAILCSLAATLYSTKISAAPFNTPHVQAELVSRHTSLRPDSEAELALSLKIIDHWHTYWQNPGDSGLPTRLTWSLPDGFAAGPIAWPHPKKLPLGPLMNFGYEGEVLHLVRLQVPANVKSGTQVTLRAKAEWLVCSDVCIPESADLVLMLPIAASAPSIDSRREKSFVQAYASLPKPLSGWQAKAVKSGNRLTIDLAPPSAPAASIEGVSFFPIHEGLIANAEKQAWSKTAAGYRLIATAAEPFDAERKAIEGVLVSTNGWGGAITGNAVSIVAPLSIASANDTLQYTPPAGESDIGLVAALLFAFAGGIILNLMPCVFPVLGIKVLGFARHAQNDPALVRRQGVAFSLGVLISFWILAGAILLIRAAGESIGWGFQLQSPLFVTLLAALFMLMALNLSGVFEMGLSLQASAGNLQMTSSRGTLADAFLSGVLATVVATPCTAPMMGAALGFTLSQPAYVALLVFTSIAAGMALPVVVLSFSPVLLKRIPKPGPWMNTLKQLMAFPLFATVAWLAWVLGSQTDNDGIGKLLFGLVGIALAAWAYGHWQASKPKLALLVAIAFGVAGLVIAWPAEIAVSAKRDNVEAEWVPYSKQKLAELRSQNKAVFIDFTATWCITCQVNKRIALNDQATRKRFDELKIIRMKADWTLKDPDITSALAEFGRNGVPLYVYYPISGNAQVLPEILTPSVVLNAIEGGKK
jgi:thiol:disulfide interchange protein DsbD